MNKYFLFFSIFLSCLTETLPQNMNFEFDFAQFSYDSVSNYVEFYYSFNESCLQFIHTDTIDYVEGLLRIEIYDTTSGKLVVDKQWIIPNEVQDTSDLNRSLVGVIGFIINEGAYKVIVTGSDRNNQQNKKNITDIFIVKPFLDLNVAISDIQLASNIIQGSENTSSIFYKNTYEVTPLPASICGEQQPVLFYYSELYNLQRNSTPDNYRLDELVVNSRGNVVSSKSKKINSSVNSRVEVGIIKVHKLPTDTYTLFINLVDSSANYGVASSKRFFVYNPSIVSVDSFQTTVSPVLSTTFGAMSEEELDDLFAKSKYIATDAEKDKYKLLSTVEAKREFIYNFWKNREENPSFEKKVSYQTYIKRIEECNSRFSAIGKKGWQTDRGRVYMIYGEPSEIERYPNETNTKPYEIWHYNDIEGGVIFIFGDITGFNDYLLLHSTKRGELRDDYWQRRIAVQ
jgi:GWxTD domain-containing protein